MSQLAWHADAALVAAIRRASELLGILAEHLLDRADASRQAAESDALRTGFRRKPDSIPMIADSR
jgi:hypothetical protein